MCLINDREASLPGRAGTRWWGVWTFAVCYKLGVSSSRLFFPHEARVQIVRTQKLFFSPLLPPYPGLNPSLLLKWDFFPSAFHRGFLLLDGSDSSAFSHQLLFLALPQYMHLSSDPSCTITNKSLNPALIAGAWICGGLFKIMVLDEVWLGFFFPFPTTESGRKGERNPWRGFSSFSCQSGRHQSAAW